MIFYLDILAGSWQLVGCWVPGYARILDDQHPGSKACCVWTHTAWRCYAHGRPPVKDCEGLGLLLCQGEQLSSVTPAACGLLCLLNSLDHLLKRSPAPSTASHTDCLSAFWHSVSPIKALGLFLQSVNSLRMRCLSWEALPYSMALQIGFYWLFSRLSKSFCPHREWGAPSVGLDGVMNWGLVNAADIQMSSNPSKDQIMDGKAAFIALGGKWVMQTGTSLRLAALSEPAAYLIQGNLDEKGCLLTQVYSENQQAVLLIFSKNNFFFLFF